MIYCNLFKYKYRGGNQSQDVMIRDENNPHMFTSALRLDPLYQHMLSGLNEPINRYMARGLCGLVAAFIYGQSRWLKTSVCNGLFLYLCEKRKIKS